MKKSSKKIEVKYTAIKVGKKPVKIQFYDKEGREIYIKGYKTYILSHFGKGTKRALELKGL